VCRHNYYAHSAADLEMPTTKAGGGVDCRDSGGFGGGGCGTVGYAEVDANGVTRLYLGCDGPGCRYSGVADATVGNLIAKGEAHQECSGVGKGSCTLGVKAELRPDRERENFKVDAFGSCVGTGGVNCKGTYSTRIALGTSTTGECSGVGSGGCHSRTESGKGNPVFSYGTCIEGLACDWKSKTHSDAGIKLDDESLAGRSRADCSTSSAQGAGGCVTAAGIEVRGDNMIVAFASCHGGVGPACSYDARVDAKDRSGRNSADGWEACGQQAAGSCGVSAYALTFTNSDKLHGEAIAGGTCTGTAGTVCSGGYRTHVDSGRDTWSTCTGTGAGRCHGVADPSNARSTGTGTGHIESKSPDEHKKGSFTTYGPLFTPVTIGANTHENFGRFLINQGRNLTDIGADIGTHFGNWGHLAWTGKEEPRLPGESEEEYTARIFPLKAGWDEGVQSFKQQIEDYGTHFGNIAHQWVTLEKEPHLPGESEEQYNARVFPLKPQWDHSMGVIGKIVSGRAGHELFWDPVGTVQEAISGPAMIIPGGGSLVKFGAKSGRGGDHHSEDSTPSIPDDLRHGGLVSPEVLRNVVTPDADIRLGADANCVNAVCAYGTTSRPDVVIPDEIAKAGRGSHDPGTAHARVQKALDGRFIDTTRAEFERRVADAPDGTGVVAWGWAKGAATSHMIFGLKTGDGMRFYDQRGRLTKEQAGAELDNIRKLLVRGSGRSDGTTPDLSHVPPVGVARSTSGDPGFDALAKENRAIRDAPYTDGANRKIKNRWPQRTVSTGRAGGTVNGRPFDEKIAAASGEAHLLKGTGAEHLPGLPPDGHLIFKTREFDNTPRKNDSEPKAFEKLARDILEVGSGQSRKAVEDAIVDAIQQVPKADGYPVSAKDVIDRAATRLGVDLDDIKISVDMVIDFPRGLREMPTERQICGSCQSLMRDFEEAFRDNVTIRAQNLNGETLW
jgi:hypothetical protein